MIKKEKKFRSVKASRLTSTIFSYITLGILSIIWLYPILWIILSAFRVEYRDGNLITTVVGNYFPKGFGFENFKLLFENPTGNNPFIRWFTNTLIVSVFTFILSTLFTLSVAYVMSKLR